MKRIVSLILVCSIFMAIVVPVSAVDTSLTTNKADEKSVVTVFEISDDITLATEDYENGDTIIKQIEKGDVTTFIYIDRQACTMTSIDYDQGRKVKTEQMFYPVDKIEAYAPARDYTYVGAIEYKCVPLAYVSEVTRLMHLGYLRYYDQYSTYDLYGEYKDFATIVGLACSLLNLPGAIAGSAVQWLLSALGISMTITPLLLPRNTVLQASETSYHWRLQDDNDGNRYTMFSGTRYIITEPTAGETVYQDRYFYVPAYYNRRDNDYALKMFGMLYGKVNSVRVNAWKPA